MTRAAPNRWTEPRDLVDTLQRRWARGEFLDRHARGEMWEPISLPVRGPTATELATKLGEAQQWASRWRAAHPRYIRLETSTVGGRLIGTNEIPSRVWIDTPDSLWGLLGVRPQVSRYDDLAALTAIEVPALLPWIADHALRVVAAADVWPRAIDVVEWLSAQDIEAIYLRQVDVPGVDTKFLETNRSLISDLLTAVLPPERIDATAPRTDLVARFGFRRKPQYVRLRTLDPSRPLPGGFLEVTAVVDAVAALGELAARVLIVENEISYLALPESADTIAILGAGYGLGRLAGIDWLHQVDLLYWGDLDTHGFAILDGLRAHFPRTRSILMDKETLLRHEIQWGHEPNSSHARPLRLDDAELRLYNDLRDNTFGPSIRLEQERVAFHLVGEALEGASHHD
jgi:hypothetical protein